MRNNNFEKHNSWAYANKSVLKNIQKNEFVRNIRANLLKRKKNKPSS